MGLSTTLNIAQSALTTNAALTTLVSRNIAGVNDPNYSSRSADLITTPYGSQIGPIRAATDDALFYHLLQAKSDSAASSAVSTGLDKINETLGLSTATTTDTSPATMLGALTSALQQYAASPVDTSLGQAAVTAAKSLAANLNTHRRRFRVSGRMPTTASPQRSRRSTPCSSSSATRTTPSSRPRPRAPTRATRWISATRFSRSSPNRSASPRPRPATADWRSTRMVARLCSKGRRAASRSRRTAPMCRASRAMRSWWTESR